MDYDQHTKDVIEKLYFLDIAEREMDRELNEFAANISIRRRVEHEELVESFLAFIGTNSYDYYEFSMTPLSDRIFVFDEEVFNCNKIYSDFLKGIRIIAGGELEITHVYEDTSFADHDLGIGIQTISFRCNGTEYQFEAKVEGDLFDNRMIFYMGQVVEEQNTGKQLYYITTPPNNTFQREWILFYRSKEWTDQFKECLGIELKKV